MRFVDTNVLIYAVSGRPTEAVEFCARYQLQYCDALILATARKHDCEAVYSEDMSAQQDYAGLRVINPFAAI